MAKKATRQQKSKQPSRAKSGGNEGASWFATKRPVLGFVLLFAVLMGAFYACTFLPALNKHAFPWLLRANASVSTSILTIFGEDARANGTAISSPRASISIAHGCDAIEPTALFVAAVLAFPVPLLTKVPGVLLGTLLLLSINLVRIISLFYTRIHFPKAFEIMHVDVWQPAFILLALLFWVLWAWWATQKGMHQPNVDH